MPHRWDTQETIALDICCSLGRGRSYHPCLGLGDLLELETGGPGWSRLPGGSTRSPVVLSSCSLNLSSSINRLGGLSGLGGLPRRRSAPLSAETFALKVKRVNRRQIKVEVPKRRLRIEEHDIINMKMISMMVEQKYLSCLEENATYHVRKGFIELAFP